MGVLASQAGETLHTSDAQTGGRPTTSGPLLVMLTHLACGSRPGVGVGAAVAGPEIAVVEAAARSTGSGAAPGYCFDLPTFGFVAQALGA
ncbi:hypothetical protein BHM03_00005270 [Ensete ventricosum]|nr:hypothetical protein BHM03_00005270 [Ensete ventricosum]